MRQVKSTLLAFLVEVAHQERQEQAIYGNVDSTL